MKPEPEEGRRSWNWPEAEAELRKMWKQGGETKKKLYHICDSDMNYVYSELVANL